MIWRRSFWWRLLLLGGSCLLLMGIFRVWFLNDSAPAASLSRKGPAVPKVTPLRDQRSLSAFAVVASQNLFSQDRKGQASKAAEPQATLEGHTLLGTIIIGQERAALISMKKGRGRKQSEVEVVRLGDKWEGFKVVEISNEAVVFEGKEGKKTLNFPE
ncbi:MAG: hypothetical protein ACOZF2_14635 [Thermodesulfobacteriota bacterium]